MSINPQFILGKDGLPTNVIISFEEWQDLYEKSPKLMSDWQKQESLKRVAAYHADPSSAIPFEDFLRELEIEDAEEV